MHLVSQFLFSEELIDIQWQTTTQKICLSV